MPRRRQSVQSMQASFVVGCLRAQPVCLVLLDLDVADALLQRDHLTTPTHPSRLDEPFLRVGLDLQ